MTISQCCFNSSHEDQRNPNKTLEDVLWILNEELVVKRIPAIVFVCILAAVGTLGNSLVLLTYRPHRRKSTANAFIFWMAVFDFLLCFFELPYKAFDIRFPLMYGYPALCKCFSFLEIFLSVVSLILLLCIAFDRYFVVQRPLKRLTVDSISKIVCLCVFLGFLFSLPTFFVYGQSKSATRMPGVYGWGCGVATYMVKSQLTSYWYYFLFAIFIVTCIILIMLYVRLWVAIRKWKHTTIGESMANLNRKKPFTEEESVFFIDTQSGRSQSAKHDSVTENVKQDSFSEKPTTRTPITGHSSPSIRFSETENTEDTPDIESDSSSVTKTVSRTIKHARMRRNTVIFSAIALLFVLSYLPINIIIFLRSFGVYNLSHAPLWQAQVFEVLYRSGYINNAMNPFMYAFLCPWFRLQVRKTLHV